MTPLIFGVECVPWARAHILLPCVWIRWWERLMLPLCEGITTKAFLIVWLIMWVRMVFVVRRVMWRCKASAVWTTVNWGVVLQSLSISEALGVDGPPVGAFKYAPSSLITWLYFFINAYINHQYILRSWRCYWCLYLIVKWRIQLPLATISPFL